MSEKKKSGLSARTWSVVLVIGLFGQLAWMVENMYFNVFLYNTITGDTAAIAAMVALSAATATLTTIFMGALSDRVGKRKAFIVVGYILWGLSTMSFGLVSVEGMERIAPAASAAALAAGLVVVLDCIMTFFGSTANDAAFNAWVTDVTDSDNRGRAESVLAALPLVAMLVIFGLLDPLTAQGKWGLFFVIIGGVTILGGLSGILIIKDSPSLKPNKEGKYLSNIIYGFRPSVMKANPELYTALLGLLVYSASQQVYMPYLIIYIQRFLGFDNYAIILGAVLIAASVISVLLGRVIDKAGKLRFSIPAAAAELIGLVLMFFAKDMIFVIIAGVVMLGGGMLLSACFSGLVRDNTPEGKAGLFQGIRIVFYVLLPMVSGPYIGSAVIRGTGMTYEDLGTVKQVPTSEIFLAAAAVLLLIVIPIIILARRKKKIGA